MNKRFYTTLYIALVALLFIHFAVAKFYVEPYPSFVFPSFSSVPKQQDTYEVPVQLLYAIDTNGDSIEVENDEVIRGVIHGHLTYITETMVQNEQRLNNATATRSTKKPLSKNITPQERVRFVQMLVRNLKERYPEKRFTQLLVVEGTQIYNANKPDASREVLNRKETIIKLV